MRKLLLCGALVALSSSVHAEDAPAVLKGANTALNQQLDDLRQRSVEREAAILVLQQQRNEAMDRGAAAAAQLMVAQKRLADLDKAGKGAPPEQLPSTEPGK